MSISAQDLAAMSLSPEAQDRRRADLEAVLSAVLNSCRQAASEGSTAQFFKIPRQYVSEFQTVLSSMDFVLTKTGEDAATVSWTISWEAAVKELLAQRAP